MAGLLDQVNEPSDLKKFNFRELKKLAQEVREEIIQVITQSGGHLASNLGIVELTLALHRVFESPKDKIVWDTTNQCYTHKLLTGRREQFSSIRRDQGLSGFGEPMESPHDVLCAGHAGTGLSIGLGLAQSERLQGSDSWVVAVVGDGAMTSGLSYEALNNIAHLAPDNLIVVLNDNGMSISENIGFLTHWRQKISTLPEYRAMVTRTKRLANRLPHGEMAYRMAKRLKNSLEGIVIPTTMWTEMGFHYVGPLDGHNIKQMEQALKLARGYSGKTPLLHVITHKGRGYPPAERDPVTYHQPGSPLGSGAGAPTYSQVVGDTAVSLMERDPLVVGISAAMLEGTGLAKPRKTFPDRVYDVGIAEQHAVSMAAGMASGGLKPLVSIYSTFLQRAFDQIVHDVCLPNLPVLLVIDRAGIVGEDGKTHHGAFDISYLSCLPNAVVCAPKDENELQHLLFTGYKHRGPFAIRIARGAGVGVPMDPELKELPIGRGEMVREGRDVTILALGKTVSPALDAAEMLAQEGIECLVVNARFVKPMDRDLVISAARATGRVLTVEENVLPGGFGAAVLETLNQACVTEVAVTRLGIPDAFVEHAPQGVQRRRLGLDADGIAQKVRDVFFPKASAPSGRVPVSAGEAAGV